MAVRRKKNQEYTEKISCFGGYLGGGGREEMGGYWNYNNILVI